MNRTPEPAFFFCHFEELVDRVVNLWLQTVPDKVHHRLAAKICPALGVAFSAEYTGREVVAHAGSMRRNIP